MSIDRIDRLRECGVFRDFSWPAGLPDLGKYNLVYGWNGTGKTTISRLFRSFELRRPPAAGEVVLRIGNTVVGGDAFLSATFPIRVFNRDFIQESVFPIGGGDVPPIFVVGKDSVEKQKAADQLKAARTKRQQDLTEAQLARKNAERELEKHCINAAKLIKETLQKTGSKYNNFNKAHYQDRAQQMATDGDVAVYRLGNAQRESLLVQHHETQKPKVSEIAYSLPNLRDLTKQVAVLLQRTVLSSALQSLKGDSDLGKWVHQGLGLHRDRRSDKCLFCEQPLPAARLGMLEAHFNAEYEHFLRQIDEQILALQLEDTRAAQATLPNRAELYDDLRVVFDSANAAFLQARAAVQNYLAVLMKFLTRKKGEPFVAIALSDAVPTVDATAIDKLNAIVREHNEACEEFDRRVAKARD